MVFSECLMIDIYFTVLAEAYPDYRMWMDIALMGLRIVGISAAGFIIKRGLWKIEHIGHNRKLVKDEDWKDIHMTVPRRIVVLTIISMGFYII